MIRHVSSILVGHQAGAIAIDASLDLPRQVNVACGTTLAARQNEVAVRRVAGPGDGELSVAHRDPFHGHFVAGQRAGFVGADHRDATERFHAGQSADERVAGDQSAEADSEHQRNQGR